MDMGFASSGQFAGPRTGSAPDFAWSGFDWHGLYARLATAHEARRSILALAPPAERLGSFDSLAAAALVQHGIGHAAASEAVNPTDLADGKPPAGIAANVAGPTSSGGRGK